ncbi:MAG: type IX secretion system sortase PorU [Chitinophagales bacterium]
MYKKTSLLLLTLLSVVSLYAQNTFQKSIELQWSPSNSAESTVLESDYAKVAEFKGAGFQLEDHNFPIFTANFPIPQNGKVEAILKNTIFEPILLPKVLNINEHVSTEIVAETYIAHNRKQVEAIAVFIPIRQNKLTGKYEKLVSADIHLQYTPITTQNSLQKARTYTENSVLNQGDFYKFEVTNTGIYKIDLSFIRELGFEGNVSMANIRLYGNGGGMLPELVGAERTDDLLENPIEVVDNNNNGQMDDQDYILFYAESPHTWSYNLNTGRFKHTLHPYSEFTSYFLNFDLGAGKRIAAQENVEGTPTIEVNTFDDYAFHEVEEQHLNQSGRIWYGEVFKSSDPANFVFDQFQGLDLNTPVYVETRMASRSSLTTNSFNVFANNEPLYTHSMTKVRGEQTDDYARASTLNKEFGATDDVITISTQYSRNDIDATGWLDYISLNVRRNLVFNGSQMSFRDAQSVSFNGIAKFNLSSVGNASQVWDVTDIGAVQKINLTGSGSNRSFVNSAEELREYIVFDGSQFLTPSKAVGKVARQNLHTVEAPDMILITHPNFIEEANRLAEFRLTNDGLDVKVVLIEEVYNEFSSGTPDITAIRDYMKMYYDRAENGGEAVKYLLLFGDASFDYKDILQGEEHNFVPTYETPTSIQSLSTYCSDDYFAFLDDNEGSNINSIDHRLDIGVGRLPISNETDAKAVVDKLVHYASNSSLGEWRNVLTFIADDEDSNRHFKDAESHSGLIKDSFPEYLVDKIYLDAYEQVVTPGGGRYPGANTAINTRIFNGALIMNYVGHGSEESWAHERILGLNDINNWNNLDKMPFFITATCSFSRFDDPKRVSAGEETVLSPKGGSIAIMTTTRIVLAHSNQQLNEDFLQALFNPVNGEIPRIGEIARLAKNAARNTGKNNRKFGLLGDPSLRLAYPYYDVNTTSISTQSVSETADTLRALTRVTVTGEVVGRTGEVLEAFNGVVYPTIYDKSLKLQTLGQDSKSYVADFDLRKSVIFKGRASAVNGKFTFSFVMPKDISYQFGNGRISYYAEDGMIDANGFDDDIVIGGIDDEDTIQDNEGPLVEVFMNDDSFIQGGMTSSNPVLFVKLKDESGINTVSTGIGHDITGLMDEQTANTLVLNEHYKATLDSYQEGFIEYPLSNLAPGLHQIEVKAWDVYNNSGKGFTEFLVAESAELALDAVLNFPNPVIDQTSFTFEHNRAGDELQVEINIYTTAGSLVRSLGQTIDATGFRTKVEWDGTDREGQALGAGMYFYEVKVTDSSSTTVRKHEQLVILK